MTLFDMTRAGGMMILAIVALRALLLHRLPKRAFVCLWVIALIRLLVPFAIASPVSIYTAATRIQHAAPVVQTVQTQHLAPVAHTQPDAPIEPEPEVSSSPLAVLTQSNEQPEPALPDAPRQVSNTLWVIYFLGAGALGLYLLAAYLYMRRQFNVAREIDMPLPLPSRRHVRVLVSANVHSPVTCGLFRPAILLPESRLTDDDRLHAVLMHEQIHIQRLDAPIKLLFALGLCVHWFNPLVWAMYLLCNRDVELACDERAMRLMGEARKADYAALLLDMQVGHGGINPLTAGFSRHCIKERIVAIMKYKRTSALAVALALVMIVLVTCAFATGAQLPSEPMQDPYSAAEGPAPDMPGMVQYDYSYNMYSSDYEPSDEQRALFEQSLELMTPGYQDLTVAEFEGKLQTMFPDGLSRLGIQTTDAQVELYTYINRAQQSIWPYPDSIGYRHPGDPNGEARSISLGENQLDGGMVYANVDYFLGWTVADPDGITIRQREQIIESYDRQMEDFIHQLGSQGLTAQDPRIILRAQAALLSEQLSTHAFRIKAINFNVWYQIGNAVYATPLSFIDNMEGEPPTFEPLDSAGVKMLRSEDTIGLCYGVQDGEGCISVDGGVTWYQSGFRDPLTGLTHAYDVQTDTGSLSPDNGASWWIEGKNTPEKESQWVFANPNYIEKLMPDVLTKRWMFLDW